MKELIHEVEVVAKRELKRANKEFPLFHSDHEALAIVAEEAWETKHEADLVECDYVLLKYNIFRDRGANDISSKVEQLKKDATHLASEAIQVIAMCNKWEQSREMMRNYNERLDHEAD